MDLQIAKRRVGLHKLLVDDFDERPVDCTCVLPDFLPDIAAILKCTMKPVVQSHQISGDRVTADGIVQLHVLYLDEERRCVRSFENVQPFTSVLTVKELSGGETVKLCAKTNYVNCRATGPRRVDIHGAFSVKLTVTGRVDTEIVETAEANGLYTKGCQVSYTTLGGFAEKTFTLNEVLETGSSAAIELIVRSEAHIQITDCQCLTGKAVIKGDVLLKTVYVTDTSAGTVCQAKHRIPFSQILDVDGLTEGKLCDPRAAILSCDVRPTQTPDGENRLLSVSVKSTLSLQCIVKEDCHLLTDAFHTTYPLALTVQPLTPHCITDVSRETVVAQQSITLTDDAAELLDAWSDVTAVTCGDGTLSGQLLVQMLTRDAADAVIYTERPTDFALTLVGVCDGTEADITVLETEGVLAGNRLDLRVTLLVCRCTKMCERYTAITDLQADESAPHGCASGMENCQVKVCFANAGDSVWELAKAAHASPTALMAENDLTEDTIKERTMLLVPLA